jgi:hypothetical protein
LTLHFTPLWAKNVPKFGIAHALALGLAPWLAAEVSATHPQCSLCEQLQTHSAAAHLAGASSGGDQGACGVRIG